MVNNSTYVNRFVAHTLGGGVEWKKAENVVTVRQKLIAALIICQNNQLNSFLCPWIFSEIQNMKVYSKSFLMM